MSKILRVVGIAIFGLLVLLLLVPYFVSIDNYRDRVTTLLSEETGYQVRIEKAMGFRVLPRPYISAMGIQIDEQGADPKQPPLAVINNVELFVSLKALFRGNVEIVQLNLESPHIHIQRKDAKHASSAQRRAPDKTPKTPQKPREQLQTAASRPPQVQPKSDKPRPIELRNVKISDGKMTIVRGGNTYELTKIFAHITQDVNNGRYHLKAGLDVLDDTLNVAGTVRLSQDATPIDLNISYRGSTGLLNGSLTHAPLGFNGTLDIKNDHTLTEKLLVGSPLPSGLRGVHRFFAKVTATERDLNIQDIDARFGNVTLTGKGSFNWEAMRLSADLRATPGAVTLKVRPLQSQDTIFTGRMTFASRNLQDYLKELGISVDSSMAKLMTNLRISSIFRCANDRYVFKNIALASAGGDISGDLEYTVKDTKKVTYNLVSTHFWKLARGFHPEVHQRMRNFSLSGTTSSKDWARFDTKTTLKLEDLEAKVDGTVDIAGSDTLTSAVNFAVKAQNLTLNLRRLGIAVAPKISQVDALFSLEGELPKTFKITVSRLLCQYGRQPIRLTGSALGNLTGNKPSIKSTFNIASLDYHKLFGDDARARKATHKLPPGARGAGSSQPATATAPWSKERLSLMLLRYIDSEMKFSVDVFTKDNLKFKNLRADTKIANGVMDILSIKAGLFGGKIVFKGRISSQSKQPITGTASISEVDLSAIPPQPGKVKITGGKMNASIDFTAQGHSLYDYVTNFGGVVSIKVRDGTVSGVDVNKLNNRLWQTSNVQSTLKLLKTSFSGGKTVFDTLDVVLNFASGVGTIDKFNLQELSFTPHVTGKINLPTYSLNVPVTLTFQDYKNKKVPPVTVTYFGALDAPQHEVAADAFYAFLLREVFTDVIKNIKKGGLKPKNLMKQFLAPQGDVAGGQQQKDRQSGSTQPRGSDQKGDADQAEKSQEVTPERALKSLVRGLLK